MDNNRYGYWEMIYNAYDELESFMCHDCGHTVMGSSNYCPECGRKMLYISKDGKCIVKFNNTDKLCAGC